MTKQEVFIAVNIILIYIIRIINELDMNNKIASNSINFVLPIYSVASRGLHMQQRVCRKHEFIFALPEHSPLALDSRDSIHSP